MGFSTQRINDHNTDNAHARIQSCFLLRDWKNDRKFDPLREFGRDMTEAEISLDLFADNFNYLGRAYEEPCENCGALNTHCDAIIVAVDGACRDNGKSTARAAIGACFGVDNVAHNISEVLRSTSPHTNQKAELSAGIRALKEIADIKKKIIPDSREVVMKADSEYLVKGMTEWILKWRQNGYMNSKGLPVTNGEMFKELDNLVDELNKAGVGVLFWHVPRANNREADWLANAALDR